jgi:hypothetical protein
LTKPDNVCIKGFDIIRKDRTHAAGGGTAIFIRNFLKYEQRPALYDCALTLHLEEGKLLLATGYRPPDKHISNNKWLRFLNQFHARFLLAGDFNAHHPLWGGLALAQKGTNSFAP